jgi:hypothetical protein
LEHKAFKVQQAHRDSKEFKDLRMDRLGYKVFKGHREFQERLELKVSQVQLDRKVCKEFKVSPVH